MSATRKLDIIVIDDNDMTRAVLRTILHSEPDYNVAGEASNGDSGLEMALKLRPDIICLDIIMPKTDGLEVLARLKKKLPQTMVLMVTLNNGAKTVQTAVKRGASGFIIKPFNAATVLDTMQQVAAKCRALKAQAPAK